MSERASRSDFLHGAPVDIEALGEEEPDGLHQHPRLQPLPGGEDVLERHVGSDAEAILGDDRAFGNLIEFYRATAERVAQQILYTEEAAADAVQESLIKAHRAMNRFQDGNFRSWFLRIVTNTCYDHLRRQKRRATVSLDELAEQGSLDYMAPTAAASEDPEAIALQNEGMHLLLHAIEARHGRERAERWGAEGHDKERRECKRPAGVHSSSLADSPPSRRQSLRRW